MSPRALFPGSSVVEQPAVNRLVAGSNPARGARTIKDLGRITAAQKGGFFVLATLLATSGRIRELRTRHGPLLFGRLRPVAPGCGMRRPRLSPRGEPPLPRFGSHAEPGFYSSRPSSAVRPFCYCRGGFFHHSTKPTRRNTRGTGRCILLSRTQGFANSDRKTFWPNLIVRGVQASSQSYSQLQRRDSERFWRPIIFLSVFHRQRYQPWQIQ